MGTSTWGNVTCLRSDALTTKTLTASRQLRCPDIDTVCSENSNFGACYWGHYSDATNGGQCVCLAGYTGSDCNTVNNGSDVTLVQPATAEPTPAPTAAPDKVCFQDFDDYSSSFNGIWNLDTTTPIWHGLGVYEGTPSNLGSRYLYFRATSAAWYVGSTIGSSSYFCICSVSLYTQNIGDCSGN